MDWTFLDTWIVVVGALCAVSCALLGNYLVLRKMSMMGDAISHAVLPGLAIAFLYTGTRGSWAMFLGAAVVGVLTALCTQGLSRYGRVDEGASMGVVFTILFAIGLIMIVRGADAVDLDPNCVLYGAIELTPLDTVEWGGMAIPRAALMLGVMLLVNSLFIGVCYKELLITSFDEQLAGTMGYRPAWIHYSLMTLVAVTAVAAFESVGSILVIAMLIVPGATAFLCTRSLGAMIAVSVVVALISAVGGHVAAITVPRLWGYPDTTTAGMMAVVSGVCFGAAFFFAPHDGVVSRARYRARTAMRILCEDILGLLYRVHELKREAEPVVPVNVLDDNLLIRKHARKQAVRLLERRGLLRAVPDGVHPTEEGLRAGKNLIRSHRLWESYLHTYLQLPADHVHPSAERLEHITSEELQVRLEGKTGFPHVDPQGRTIPERNGPQSHPDQI